MKFSNCVQVKKRNIVNENAGVGETYLPRKKSSFVKVLLWILAGLFVAAIFVYAIELNSTSSVGNITPIRRITDTANTLTADEQQQLNNARDLLRENKKDDALDIYQQLSQQNIAQAMFQYANLALQNKNDRIDCNDAFALLTSASDKNYLPAKTTLGFLYAFATDDAMMKELNYYSRCVFPSDVSKGAHLLMESTLQGDVTAAQWLDKLNTKQQ